MHHIKMMVSRNFYAISEIGNLVVSLSPVFFNLPIAKSLENTIDATHHRTKGVGF